MRFSVIMSLIISIFLINPALAVDNQTTQRTLQSTKQEEGPNLEEQKEQLREDARELADNFREIFEDISGISKTVLLPFIDSVSEWIRNNYAEMSQQGREKLRKSLEELRKQLNQLEGLSREKAKELFREYEDMLDSLKKNEKREPEPDTIPA